MPVTETNPQNVLNQLSKVDFAVPAIKTFKRWGDPRKISVIDNNEGIEVITAARGQAGENHSIGLTTENSIGATVALYFYGNRYEDLPRLLQPSNRLKSPEPNYLGNAKIGWDFHGVTLGSGTFELAFVTKSTIHDSFDPSSVEGRWLLDSIGHFGKLSDAYRQSVGDEIAQPRFRNPMQELATRLGIAAS